MLIEVIFYDRIGNYSPGQVAEIEDGVFLRALLKGGKADVLNPPDWTVEAADSKKAPITQTEEVSIVNIEEVPSNTQRIVEKASTNGQSKKDVNVNSKQE